MVFLVREGDADTHTPRPDPESSKTDTPFLAKVPIVIAETRLVEFWFGLLLAAQGLSLLWPHEPPDTYLSRAFQAALGPVPAPFLGTLLLMTGTAQAIASRGRETGTRHLLGYAALVGWAFLWYVRVRAEAFYPGRFAWLVAAGANFAVVWYTGALMRLRKDRAAEDGAGTGGG